MAQIPVRLTAQGMVMPLLSEQCGVTVVDGRGDLTYVPGVSSDGDIPENRGVPGIVYAENVLPSTYGWQAVGYVPLVDPFSNPDIIFYETLLVHGAVVAEEATKPTATRLRTYIGAAVLGGSTYIYCLMPDGTWLNLYLEDAGPITVSGQPLITVAHVNGYSYLSIEGSWVGVVDVENRTLIPRTLNGLASGAQKGIISSNGHLITFSVSSAAWSSTVDVEDFVPSEITGAGGGSIQEIAGDIVTCKSSPGGFIIFTDSNCVAAVYTANTAFPFEFKTIPSAGGVDRFSHVSDELVGGSFYAITTSGIQRISTIEAKVVLPNVSDFLSGRVLEWYNASAGQLARNTLHTDMGRRIQAVANRYIIISYASDDRLVHNWAIVIDAVQNRMGKLKVDSTKFFELHRTETFDDLDPRATLGVLGIRGNISRVRFDLNCTNSRGLMIFGRLQYAHQKTTQLQEVRVERTCPADNFFLSTMTSLDGVNFEPASPGFLRPEDLNKNSRRYLFTKVGVNHMLVMSGSFEMNSILVNLNTHGNTASMI